MRTATWAAYPSSSPRAQRPDCHGYGFTSLATFTPSPTCISRSVRWRDVARFPPSLQSRSSTASRCCGRSTSRRGARIDVGIAWAEGPKSVDRLQPSGVCNPYPVTAVRHARHGQAGDRSPGATRPSFGSLRWRDPATSALSSYLESETDPSPSTGLRSGTAIPTLCSSLGAGTGTATKRAPRHTTVSGPRILISSRLEPMARR